MGTVVLIMLLAWMVGIAVMTLFSHSEGGDFPGTRTAHTASTPLNTRSSLNAPLDGLDGAFSPLASMPPAEADPSASFR